MSKSCLKSLTLEDISVIIPAYKAEDYVARAIKSVIEEGVLCSNIIVVVDGVYDSTPEVASSFDDVVVIINEQNLGAQKSRNIGLKLASTELVMFLDADDYVCGGLLNGLSEVMSLSSSDLAIGPWRYGSKYTGLKNIKAPHNLNNEEWIFYWLNTGFFPPCSLLWRTSSLNSISGWDERIHKNQDGELAIRAFVSNFSVCCSLKGYGVYWQHGFNERISSASLLKSLYTSEIIYNNVSYWLSKLVADEEYKALLYRYLGEFCCKQAWSAAFEKRMDLWSEWLELANDNGYNKKYYSKITLLHFFIGVKGVVFFKKAVLPFYKKFLSL